MTEVSIYKVLGLNIVTWFLENICSYRIKKGSLNVTEV